MAHLVNFCGSDTVQGVRYANHYYSHPMAAYSIPAAAHSTIMTWQRQGEEQAYQNMLDQFAKPGKVLAFVSDPLVSDHYFCSYSLTIWLSFKPPNSLIHNNKALGALAGGNKMSKACPAVEKSGSRVGGHCALKSYPLPGVNFFNPIANRPVDG
jgi:Nicotinate phosphoribosyltransferase (NAPRTase) family